MDGIIKLTDEIKTREDNLDFLIRRRHSMGRKIDDFSESGWTRLHGFNVMMPFTTQKLLPLLRQAPRPS